MSFISVALALPNIKESNVVSYNTTLGPDAYGFNVIIIHDNLHKTTTMQHEDEYI